MLSSTIAINAVGSKLATLRFRPFTSLLMALFIGFSGIAIAEQPDSLDANHIRFFETSIRPLLVQHCYECHGEHSQESDLRVDTWNGLRQGGKAGPLIVQGEPDRSLLITAVSYRDSDLRMPPDGKLSDSQLADLKRWVEIGAPHPDANTNSPPPTPFKSEIDLEAGRQHWAFQPLEVNGQEVNRQDIDSFIHHQLVDSDLTGNAKADKRTFIRRASFDLTGLPPSQEEVERFLADDSATSYPTLIEKLLASPQYGERWGRHWLDVARYADSNGLDENVAHGNAWQYRDYVVQAFNDDKPYNAFIHEQLAGDLLDSGSDQELRNQRLIATGFLVLGPKVLAEKDEAKMEMDIIDEQLDTIGRTFMGLTLGCARCHTHKFDPISHADYYGLAGIFKSTQTMDSYATIAKWHENSLETNSQTLAREQHQASIEAVEKELTEEVASAKLELTDADSISPDELESHFTEQTQTEITQLRTRIDTLKSTLPAIPMAMGVCDGNVADLAVHLRGSHLTLGDTVQRRFPQVLTTDGQPEINNEFSGRLEFAHWLTDQNRALTARVMVNRIWRWHFGKGLVASVDNFGVQGDRPSHPELLDWLAQRFIDSGWSIKSMHRLIMLSEAYQRSSEHDAIAAQRDPANRLYWRFGIRRMEAEAIRDSLLTLSGSLDRTAGGSLLTQANGTHIFDHTSNDKSTYESTRRSIYLPVIRNHLYDMFPLFDYTDASVLKGDRDTSTIAPQALFLMNSDFVINQVDLIAMRLLNASEPQSLDRHCVIDELYLQAYGRHASEAEISRAKQFLQRFQQTFKESTTSADDRYDISAAERQAWSALCQAIVSSHEFIYVR